MKHITPVRLVAAYAFAGLVTFGHAFNSYTERINVIDGSRYPPSDDMRVAVGVICSIAWPLYLSAKLWGTAK